MNISLERRLESLQSHLSQFLIGKHQEIRLALTCILARGHLLIEDVPGVGKTTLAEGLASCFKLRFSRIQFTSDLLPSDIVGAQVYRTAEGVFEFRKGPIFNQVVLADELNRAPPRTQSALLEAMAQRQVTVDGKTHPLLEPFIVVATQNPTEFAGTYPLPDSQLDRFLVCMSLGHLSPENETRLILEKRPTLQTIQPIATQEELQELQAACEAIRIHADVAHFAVQLGNATRKHHALERGISTRAMLSLIAAAKANALWEGRDFLVPDDLRAVFIPVLAHRVLANQSESMLVARKITEATLQEILSNTPNPR
ncbi:MAG: MoxR family ATPase [Proteobacteria bacterium]|nr:MoxR family ATPase [Cystobacterineae bacterium]MCL2258633.1 MoxR family ATPase [Cystobacterineae bacterium]MCL2314952.1 MoxR family ATPase [Pseudomonadota bacterium]